MFCVFACYLVVVVVVVSVCELVRVSLIISNSRNKMNTGPVNFLVLEQRASGSSRSKVTTVKNFAAFYTLTP